MLKNMCDVVSEWLDAMVLLYCGICGGVYGYSRGQRCYSVSNIRIRCSYIIVEDTWSWGQENNGHVDLEQWYGGMTALTFQVSIRQHHEITFCIGKSSPYSSSKDDKRYCLSSNKVQGPPST